MVFYIHINARGVNQIQNSHHGLVTACMARESHKSTTSAIWNPARPSAVSTKSTTRSGVRKGKVLRTFSHSKFWRGLGSGPPCQGF